VSKVTSFNVRVDWHDDSLSNARVGGKYLECGTEDDLRERLETLVGQAIVMLDACGHADLRIKLSKTTSP
jgi:hypothetical protein